MLVTKTISALLILAGLSSLFTPAMAQDATAQPVPDVPAQDDGSVPDVQPPAGAVQRPAVPPARVRSFEPLPVAVLQGLDKVTARTSTVEAKVGEVVQFGQLSIQVKACRKAPPIETPESAAFLEVMENSTTPGAAPAPVFVGWMFASSPALSAMEHPVYDIWVKDCRKSETKARSSAKQ
jgi:hypothetical protein